MIPVEQSCFFDVDTGERGDCLRACLASLLELERDEVPHFAAMGDRWWNEWTSWLRNRGWVLATAHWQTDPLDKTKLIGWTEGYWLAGVKSLRTKPDGTHLQHMVVMLNGELVWDPHPARAEGHLGFNDGYTLRPYDPAPFIFVPKSAAEIAAALQPHKELGSCVA